MSMIYVSKQGLDLLNERLKTANKELVSIRAEKSTAYTATGDTWHDNPYFNKLEQEERRKSEDIAQLVTLIASATVFSVDKRNTTRVQMCSIVHLYRYYKVSGEEEEFVWEVAGYGETDVSKRLVAYNSPLMQAVMGLHIGGTAQSASPKGPVEYEVLGLYEDWKIVPDNIKS